MPLELDSSHAPAARPGTVASPGLLRRGVVRLVVFSIAGSRAGVDPFLAVSVAQSVAVRTLGSVIPVDDPSGNTLGFLRHGKGIVVPVLAAGRWGAPPRRLSEIERLLLVRGARFAKLLAFPCDEIFVDAFSAAQAAVLQVAPPTTFWRLPTLMGLRLPRGETILVDVDALFDDVYA